MKLFRIAALTLLLAAVSCGPKVQPAHDTLPLVREIMQDGGNRFHQLLKNSQTPDPLGDIYIIGAEDAAFHLAEDFARCDARDNIDGSLKSDGLPDFAGETISCVIDTTGLVGTMINSALLGKDDRSLREFVVNSVLSLMDTVCHISPYDIDGLGRKNPAKMVILAAPYLAQYAMHDIDTLMQAFNSSVPVICPAMEMYDVAFSSHPGRDITMGLIYHERFSGSEVYANMFRAACREKGSIASSFAAFPEAENPDSSLVSFLDNYIAAGYTRPLNTIAIDTYTVSLETMKSSLAGMISVMNEESMKYGKYIAKDFRFLHTTEAIASRCYDLLRSRNAFTHNISKPRIAVYYANVDPENGNNLFLVPGNYVQD